MANYVLVHGGNMSADTWNKLANRNDFPAGTYLGGKIWDNIIPSLKAQNHHVFSLTLKDASNYNLSVHVEQVCTLITKHDLKDIILVGHSYGGMIITGVADKMADRIRRLVYLDAALPEPGQSLSDILALAGLDPIAVVEGSHKAYVEKIQFDPQKIKSLSKTYILCTESEFACVTNLAKQKIAADSTEWSYIELPTSHVPMASMPDQFTQLLLEVGQPE